MRDEQDNHQPIENLAVWPNRTSYGLNVLIVGDHLKSIAILIRDCSHRVLLVPDGRSACRTALAKPPDVVLLDLTSPDLDGWEVAKRLQEPSWAKKPFLIALDSRKADQRRSRKAGIDLHLVKPVDANFLRRVLDRFYRVIIPPDASPEEETGSADLSIVTPSCRTKPAHDCFAVPAQAD
jgi:CheY-like chemotaxis protein